MDERLSKEDYGWVLLEGCRKYHYFKKGYFESTCKTRMIFISHRFGYVWYEKVPESVCCKSCLYIIKFLTASKKEE